MADRSCVRLRAPGSKSQTQRLLIVASLAEGESELVEPLDCDDTEHLREALTELGAAIDVRAGRWRVRGGLAGRATPRHALDCGDGGTTARFLAPLALLLDGELLLDGSARLRERPLGGLLDALRALGVAVRCLALPEALPVGLSRTRPPRDGARIAVDASRSSQFASALLLVGPRLPGGLRLELDGAPVSRPYLELTLHAMHAFGARVSAEGGRYVVAPGPYVPCRVVVEADWSSAAFLLAGGFIAGREVVLENVDERSAQGDRAIVAHLAELARRGRHRLDLTDCPDLVAPLAAAAVFARDPTELVGLAHARLKESDRLAVLAEGLRLAGVTVACREEGLCIEPGAVLRAAALDPRGDHRMAMAFGLLSLRDQHLSVTDHACVAKSYPGFWRDLERLRA
jgi:3-phosphoshikimate 1-carboxyvinyltransferase